MNELLLIVTIAGQRVALPAAAVESVVELDTLIPVPRAARMSQDCRRSEAGC
jgi:purine-binding chemotaxis protein CheW